MQHSAISPSRTPAALRAISLAGVAAITLAGCTPPRASRPAEAIAAAPDTLWGMLHLVWGGTRGTVSYLLTDDAGRTSTLQLTDSLAAAVDIRSLDRRRVRAVVHPATPGAVRVQAIGPAPRPGAP